MASLYRRHRPQSFAEVVGQEPVVRTLGNAITGGKVHHAYLFVGSRGTGKTSIAKILARSLNCVDGPTLTPCGKCESCLSIANGTSLDVIEMDAASNNSVDDIRDLREKVGFAPALGGWKVYILDEAHMLSTAAWNAFLKTLEEPPPHAIFVLATTEAHKVPATIVDRCHRFDFQRPSLDEILTVLRRVCDAEGIEADDRALRMIARAAEGSFRDALGTLDQLVTYGSNEAGGVSLEDVMSLLDVSDAESIFAATDAIAGSDPAGALMRVSELAESGRDPVQFMVEMTEHLRQLVVVQTLGAAPESFSVTADQVERIESQAKELSRGEVVRAIDLLAAAIAASKEGSDGRIQLEIALLKAASPRSDASMEAVFARLERLEEGAAEPSSSAAAAKRRPAAAQPAKPLAPVESQAPEPVPQAPEPVPQPPEPAPQAIDSAVSPDRAGEPDAPEVGTESAPASVGNGSSETVEQDVSVIWPAVLERVRDSDGGELLSEYLTPARPLSLEGDVLVLSYPQSASFSKRKVEHPANGERVADMLKMVAGRPLRIRVELTDDEQQPALPGEIDEDELIRRIKDAFDAEEVTVGAENAAGDTHASEEN